MSPRGIQSTPLLPLPLGRTAMYVEQPQLPHHPRHIIQLTLNDSSQQCNALRKLHCQRRLIWSSILRLLLQSIKLSFNGMKMKNERLNQITSCYHNRQDLGGHAAVVENLCPNLMDIFVAELTRPLTEKKAQREWVLVVVVLAVIIMINIFSGWWWWWFTHVGNKRMACNKLSLS